MIKKVVALIILGLFLFVAPVFAASASNSKYTFNEVVVSDGTVMEIEASSVRVDIGI